MVALFIILCIPSLNNLPYGDDNAFIFKSYLLGVPSVFDFWNPYSNFFKSWPLPYSIFTLLLRSFGENIIIYRVINIALHIVNCFLFRRVLSSIRPSTSGNERFILFSVFLIHPISLITFNWVFQLKTLLCVTFSLLTILGIHRVLTSSKWVLTTLMSFFFALNSKIACVLLPFYGLFLIKKSKNKASFGALTALMLLMSLYYGLINVKGINSFYVEKIASEKSPIEYSDNIEKIHNPEQSKPQTYIGIDLSHQLSDSAKSVSEQLLNPDDLFDKYIISMFNFGRYIASAIGLNLYSISYEPTWVSLANHTLIYFICASLIFFIFFVSTQRWKELALLLIFFIPISGFFYVPYMKYSYIADHWIYPALPFLLSFFVIGRNQKVKIALVLIIGAQFLATTFSFRTTTNITQLSLERYNNPFLISYLIEEAEDRGDYNEAYALTNRYIEQKGIFDDFGIKTKLRINLSYLKNDLLQKDAMEFIEFSIAKNRIQVAKEMVDKLKSIIPSEKVPQYQLIIKGASLSINEEDIQKAKRLLK